MPSDLDLNDLNAKQAVEDVVHEIRSRQLSILTLVQILRRLEAGDVDITNLPPDVDTPQSLDAIQQCVHEISDLLDALLIYMRNNKTL